MAASKFDFVNDYCKWVVKHPDLVGQIESFARISSYLIAGRVTKSAAFSEFLYSAANVVVLIHDQILQSALRQRRNAEEHSDKLHVFVTTVEYLQVFLEIGAGKLWGDTGKWIAIFVIQTIKFLWRAFVLLQRQSGLALTRPIPPLNRKIVKNDLKRDTTFEANLEAGNYSTFTLPSGRIIRTVSSAPPLQRRTWQPPRQVEGPQVTTVLKGLPLLGEVMYTAKPLCHLLVMRLYGTSSWLPWLTSMTMDAASIKLLAEAKLNAEERKELRRRQWNMLMYLLRSPFYDRYSRTVVAHTLLKLSRLPLVGVFPKQLNQYLPYWQRLYSYTWDS